MPATISNASGARAVKSAATRRAVCFAAGGRWLCLLVSSPIESTAAIGRAAVLLRIEVSEGERGVDLEIWAITTSESSPESVF